MITGKLYGGLSVIGEAILLKELTNNEVLVMVLDLPSPMEDMPIGVPHGCRTIVWKATKAENAQEDALIYVSNS
jgi:hypothetical protein